VLVLVLEDPWTTEYDHEHEHELKSMNKKTIADIDVHGKRVLVRVDFNVPQDENGEITDDRRIRAALPTIQYLIEHGARTILVSHLGRPKGSAEDRVKLTLKPVADRLSDLLRKPVPLAPDCIGPEVEAAASRLENGGVLLLENVRFHPEEESNDPRFARQLAALAEVYVNDAFGTAHRAHASTEGVAHVIPGVAGFLMQKEIDYLGGALSSPKRPFVAILGGAKIKDKIPVIENLLPKVDLLIVGGGMAYTFYKSQGLEIGNSLLDETSLDFCAQILREVSGKIQLPVDCVVADAFSDDAAKQVVPVHAIPAGWQGLDIGPETVRIFSSSIKSAGTVIWNGPMGVFEMPSFAAGTRGIAQAMAEATAHGAITIVGGGDSAAAVEEMGFADRISHISTGGGASLEFLEGKPLPGLVALQDN
jgi:phosphoglycerate kinase